MTNVNRRHALTHDAAWERRTGTTCKGKIIPFGAKVSYRLAPEQRPEFQTFSLPIRGALFLGWYVLPGAKFHGDYWVLDLENYVENPEQAGPRRVKEIYDTFDRCFPAAELKEHARLERHRRAACEREGLREYRAEPASTKDVGV